MKTPLPESITTIAQAKEFLTNLYNNGETYHPEDDATDLVGSLFTQKEGEQLNKLMSEIYALEGNESAQSMVFDPCQFLLELDPDYVNEEMYKGYEIRTKKNPECNGATSIIYRNSIPVGGTVSDLTTTGKTSIEKAKAKIDNPPAHWAK